MGRITDMHRTVRAQRGPLMRGPDIDGFLDHVDVQMGPAFTRRMLKDFPDVERALSRGRIARAWAGLQDAYDAGHLTDGEWQTLVGLAEEHDISKPDDGEDDDGEDDSET